MKGFSCHVQVLGLHFAGSDEIKVLIRVSQSVFSRERSACGMAGRLERKEIAEKTTR